MKRKVLICDEVSQRGIKLLKEAGIEVDVKLGLSPKELKRESANYDTVIVREKTVIDKEMIEASKRLKVIARAGVGVDNIDVKAAEERGIEVSAAAEALASSVAELTIGLMLSLARKITLADRSMKERKRVKKELMGTLLKGKTLGIVGLDESEVR